jgi:hypothetical protein
MLRMISGSKYCRSAAAPRRYPARGLHLVDIENLAGTAIPSLGLVREVQVSTRTGWHSEPAIRS